MSEQLWWYAARAGGLVAWALLASSTTAGIALAFRRTRPSAMWLCTVHRHLAALAVVFVGVHLASLVADSYVELGPADLAVPFASEWRPGAVAWGVVALWLLAAVQVTSMLRRKLPRAAWRRVHLASHGLFVASTAHLVAAGTDASSAAVRAMTVAGTVAVLAAALARLAPAATRRPARDAARRGTVHPA